MPGMKPSTVYPEILVGIIFAGLQKLYLILVVLLTITRYIVIKKGIGGI